MGCYDTVIVPCPKCGTEEFFQSKSGPCALDTYALAECPSDVLLNVNRHSPHTCAVCGTRFEVELMRNDAGLLEPMSVVHCPGQGEKP